MSKPVAPLSKQNAKALGARIRKLRLQLGLDQAQFAKVIGRSQQVISAWESGSSLRSVDTGMRLGKLLDQHRL